MGDDRQKAVGGVLRTARKALGKRIADIANQLHVDPAQLEALEEGRADERQPVVVQRAHLRVYARALGLNAELLLQGDAAEAWEEFRRRREEADATGTTSSWDERSSGAHRRRAWRGRLRVIVVMTALVILLGVLLVVALDVVPR